MKRRNTPNIFDDGEHIYSNANYWKEQKKTGPGGRPKKIPDPQTLWEHACDYFQECDELPWVKVDYKGKFVEKVEIPTTRPYTWGGFDEYLRSHDVIAKLEDYKANRAVVKNNVETFPYAEFSEVITRIGNIIRTQKLEGAMVGAFDSRIVSAEIGLAQKVEHSVKKQVFKIGGQEIEIG